MDLSLCDQIKKRKAAPKSFESGEISVRLRFCECLGYLAAPQKKKHTGQLDFTAREGILELKEEPGCDSGATVVASVGI